MDIFQFPFCFVLNDGFFIDSISGRAPHLHASPLPMMGIHSDSLTNHPPPENEPSATPTAQKIIGLKLRTGQHIREPDDSLFTERFFQQSSLNKAMPACL